METTMMMSNRNGEGGVVEAAWKLTRANLGRRVTALGASLLLLMERARAAATAQRVRLGVALTERGGTFGLHGGRGRMSNWWWWWVDGGWVAWTINDRQIAHGTPPPRRRRSSTSVPIQSNPRIYASRRCVDVP